MDRLSAILGQMTLTEKVCQLFQLHSAYYGDMSVQDFTGPDHQVILDDDKKYMAGSIIGELADVRQMKEIQKKYAKHNRLGIPPVVMADVIHGYKTIFPIPLAMSCTFDETLAEEASRVAAVEASACGVHVTFAPMADLVRDPRWGRVMEATGEDPYLNALFARAAVKGFQGDDLKDNTSLGSCVKHLAAYGAPEGGREYNTVDMSRGMLQGYYLDGYKAAVEAGCQLVMAAFNTVDMIPATCNRWLLSTLLRDKWNFDGAVISDWGAVGEVTAHRVAADAAQAVKRCLSAGVDIDMMSGCYPLELEEIAKAEPEIMEQLDCAVLRVLKLKENLGLLDHPKTADPERAKAVLLCRAHRESALKIALRSVVLLKNKDLLPVRKETRIALVGSMADEKQLNGWWHCQGNGEDCVTLYEGLNSCKVPVFLPRIRSEEEGYLEECCRLANICDVAVVVCGEKEEHTGEGSSKVDLHLDKKDSRLIKALAKQGSKTVLVIHSGRPLIIAEETADADAVIQAWFLGTESGNALAQILLGIESPQGRLTMTFPRHAGQIPLYYNHFSTGRPKHSEESEERYISKYIDCQNSPLFPFGYGLLYTEMEYSALSLSSESLKPGGEIVVGVRVKNVGKRAGTETIQLYLSDCAANIVRPVMELKGKCKAELMAGEAREIRFTVAEDMLDYCNENGDRVAESGKYIVSVGRHAQDTLSGTFVFEKE